MNTSNGILGARVFLLLVASLIVVRIIVSGHAPNAIDAHITLVACVFVAVMAFTLQLQRALVTALVAATMTSVLSVLCSWHWYMSALSLPLLLAPVVFFLLGSGLASTTTTYRSALTAVAIGGSLHAMLALTQRFYLWPEALTHASDFEPHVVERLTSMRPIGFAISPDLAGGLSLMASASALAWYFHLENNDKKRYLALALAVMNASTILLVKSFGTILSAMVFAALIALALVVKHRSKTMITALAIVSCVSAIGLVVVIKARGLQSLAESMHERVLNYQAAWKIFVENPLFGVGFAQFQQAYFQYRAPLANSTRYAHNALLHTLAEGGVVGLLLPLVLVLIFARTLVEHRRQLGIDRIIIIAAVIAMLCRGALDYDFQIAQNVSIIALLAGLSTIERASFSRSSHIFAWAMCVLLAVTSVLNIVRENIIDSGTHDKSTVSRYATTFAGDTEAQLLYGRMLLSQAANCRSESECNSAAADARVHLEKQVGAAHPSAVNYIQLAQYHLITQAPDAAARALNIALALDGANVAAHQMQYAIARANHEDTRAIVDDAARFGIARQVLEAASP